MYPKAGSFIQSSIYYVWALPKYIEFASVLASFYSSVFKFCSAISLRSFYPISFKPWHNDP